MNRNGVRRIPKSNRISDMAENRAREAIPSTVEPKPAQAEPGLAMLENEERFRQLVEGVEDYAIYLLDAEGRVASWNIGAERLTGYREAEVLGRHYSLFFDTEDIQYGKPQHLLKTAATLGRVEDEGGRIRKDGGRFWANAVITALPNKDGTLYGFANVARDLTRRKLAEDQIRKLNRTLGVLNDVNQAIIRIRELPLLFTETCRIAVANGFRMAWIGLFNSETRRIEPVAYAGVEEGYLNRLDIDVDDNLRGRGPVGLAFHTGGHVICNDIAHDPSMAPWRADALQLGYRAIAAFPLLVAGGVRGTIAFYAVETDFFDVEEIKLLDELARDLAFGIEFAEQEAKRQAAEAALQRYAQRLEILRELDVGLLEGRSIHVMVDNTLRYLRRLIPCSRASILLLESTQDHGQIFAIDHSNPTALVTGTRVPTPPEWLARFGADRVRVIDDLRTLRESHPPDDQLVKEGIVSALRVLLMAQSTPIGMLSLSAVIPGFFTEEHKAIVMQVAAQLAIAIRQMQLSDAQAHYTAELERHVGELKQAQAGERAQRQFAEAMRDSLAALSGSLNVDDIMQQLLASAATVVPSEAGSIILFDGEEGHVAYLRGYSPEATNQLLGYRFPIESLTYGHILTMRQPYIVADTNANDEWIIIPANEWIRSSIGVPIERHGEVIGALILDSATPNLFVQADIEKLQSFAHYANLALENAYHITHLEQVVEERTAELKTAKEQVEAILYNSLYGITFTDQTLRIQQANPAFLAVFGWEGDDYVDVSLLDLVVESEFEQVKAFLQAVLRGGEERQFEARFRRRNGAVFAGELGVNYVQDKGLVCAIRDITKRKQAEAALSIKLADEHQFQHYLQALHDLTIELAAINELDEFYRRAVELGLEHFGFERLGLLLYDAERSLAIGAYGTDAQGRVQAEPHIQLDPASLTGILQRALEQSERFAFDEQAQLYHDLAPIGVGWNAAAVLWNGQESLGWLAADNGVLHRPVTKHLLDILALYSSTLGALMARKQLEATLRVKNIELEKANQAKDQFLAGMSHELRTPLNAIIGYTGTLLMKLPGPLTVDQEKQLQIIRTSARHLLSLISDLLDLTKIDSGNVELLPEPVNCLEVIDEVSAILRPLAEAKGLHFALDLAMTNVMLISDRRALSQILINLGTNAIKFTEHGEVRLSVTQERINGRQRTEIHVIDTGIGIRPEDQRTLFQAFAQIDIGEKRQEGTGLGLYLSQKLAGLLGGRITFQSEYGKGSIFTLTIESK
jgi:PAS domain S-box-containing protein